MKRWRWPWQRARLVPRPLADVYIHAQVLANLTEHAVADQAVDFRPSLLAHARQLIESIEDSRRSDIPASAKVLLLAKRGHNV